jgi:orotate phosphoribosyltransferase
MNLDSLKSQYFDGIYQTKAFLIKNEPFTLQSGKKSHLYLNHRNFLSQSRYLSLIANIYYELTKHLEYDFQLGAVDSVTSPIIVGAMCAMFNKNYVVIKSEPLKHGTQEYIYGNINQPIILIDDMTSTGGTLVDAAQKVRLKGGLVKHAIISAYRDESAINHLQSQDINLMCIASFSEILTYLSHSLTKNEKNIVKNELNLT